MRLRSLLLALVALAMTGGVTYIDKPPVVEVEGSYSRVGAGPITPTPTIRHVGNTADVEWVQSFGSACPGLSFDSTTSETPTVTTDGTTGWCGYWLETTDVASRWRQDRGSINVYGECNDGIDNDGNGLIDYPDDPGCSDIFDPIEDIPACSDGIDNDGDGLIDFPADPGCLSATDDNERNPEGPQCDNGIDDDGDGFTDYPDDPHCDGPDDDQEQEFIALTNTPLTRTGAGTLQTVLTIQGAEGGIASVLWAIDSGTCTGLSIDNTAIAEPLFTTDGTAIDCIYDVTVTDGESNTAVGLLQITVDTPAAAQCNDGIDNDGNGLIDMADPCCTSPLDAVEGGCGDGLLQWTHADAVNVDGFHVHYGSSSGSYTTTVDVGLPTPAAGVYSYTLSLPAVPNVYVAATAYGAGFLTSPYSNEVVFAGASVPGVESWSENFEGFSVGTAITNWFDTAAASSMTEDDSLFGVADVSGNKVLTSDSTDSNIHSHYVGTGASAWSAYEVRGRMYRSNTSGGVGVTAYSNFPTSDIYYRLRTFNGAAWELNHHPLNACAVSSTGVIPQSSTWYRYKLRVTPISGANQVQAKIWIDGAAEPTSWQASCNDTRGSRPTSGTVGVYHSGPGTSYWDDFEVVTE